jgi:hypothetical protein
MEWSLLPLRPAGLVRFERFTDISAREAVFFALAVKLLRRDKAIAFQASSPKLPKGWSSDRPFFEAFGGWAGSALFVSLAQPHFAVAATTLLPGPNFILQTRLFKVRPSKAQSSVRTNQRW